MSTGVESFMDPAAIGPLYPFAGLEWLFAVVAIILWLAWHVKNAMDEHREYIDAAAHYKRLRLERVMFRGGTALIPSETELHEEHPPVAEDPPLSQQP